MSFLDIIKKGAGGVVKGAGSVAKGIGSTIAAAAQPVQEQPSEGTPSPEPQDKPSTPFTLPDLDPKDPDYADRKAVHDAMIALDKQWSESMPNVDFEGHYKKIAEDMKKAPKDREWNVLSKLAVALGTQNPDHPYEPNQGLATMSDVAKQKGDAERKDFEEIMGLRKEALSGHIRQLMETGKFRQALSELNAREQMNVTKARKEHEFKLSEEEAKGKNRKDVARINAQGAMQRAEARLNYLKEQGAKLRLSPSDKALMDAEYRTSERKLAETKKQWQEGMISDEQVEVAEEEHRQEMMRIHNHYDERELGERPAPAGPSKEPTKSAAGMAPNPEDPWFKK